MLTTFLALSAIAPKVSPWEKEVVYQIFPRSFCDSNGDKIGDFRGIESKLGYLQSLGVTILLNPIQSSQTYHNYFADNLLKTDPEFGTNAQFWALVKSIHRRNIKVLLDMEPQYVTDGHPWYKAVIANPAAKERDYLWKIGRALLDVDEIPWYDKKSIKLAAINPDNPHVKETIRDVFRYWAAPNGKPKDGVDGFRIDHMMDDLDLKGEKKGMLHNFWLPIERDIRRLNPKIFFVGEQADWGYGQAHFAKGGVDAVYDFPLWNALIGQDLITLTRTIRTEIAYTPKGKTGLIFIENHDVDRFATQVQSDPARERFGAVLSLTLKGTPSIYYGQELGMQGKSGSWNSDGNDIPRRLAMRWSKTLEAPGQALWYKNTGPWWSTEYSKDNDGISVEEEDPKPDSLLNFYKRLIRIRRDSQALSQGSYQTIEAISPDVFGFKREWNGESILVFVNTAATPVNFTLSRPAKGVSGVTNLWDGKKAGFKQNGMLTIPVSLGDHGFQILRMK